MVVYTHKLRLFHYEVALILGIVSYGESNVCFVHPPIERRAWRFRTSIAHGPRFRTLGRASSWVRAGPAQSCSRYPSRYPAPNGAGHKVLTEEPAKILIPTLSSGRGCGMTEWSVLSLSSSPARDSAEAELCLM
ncbi:uncharacterized protein PHACADRAFT_259942 [Phanerochaete carnosa HHB-10118-sp]|uniref:Uncharacterized protein n=1 Tax=Phanerochaete carnosa (strain HHB-10118-sp) TaxID=650164 RepID=K5VPX8_PHACS|nr:uncharacterized protein PHACADRAFT_259942 [Phanerochaete carnosa HHB-10118-sp]EKM53523.1 hypothetical protein PHACADRAFT_259942 [Phanerochaete carnosa HHB-10118-sp]